MRHSTMTFFERQNSIAREREFAGFSVARVVTEPLLLAFLAFALFTASVHAQSTFVYTNDNPIGPNSVSAFSVGPGGSLTLVPGSPFVTGGTGDGSGGLQASHRVVTSRNFLYASNDGSNSISAFQIEVTTGVLTAVSGSPFATQGSGTGGISLAATPDGRFLFAGSNSSGNISVFSIAPGTGALTLIGSPIPTGPAGVAGTPAGIKVSPNGKLLAVALPFDPGFFTGGSVAMFTIDGSTGTLSSVPGSPFATGVAGAFATDVDISCRSDLLFNADGTFGTTTVSVFSIDANGVLNPITGSPFIFPFGANSNVGVLSPDNQHLFVSNNSSNQITSLDIASGGSLSEETNSPFTDSGGTTPDGMAINREGSLLYVANQNNVVAGFQIDSDGGLTQVAASPTGVAGGLQSLTVFRPASCLPRRAFVANEGSNTVSVIDPATDSVTATVGVGSGPAYTAVTPDGTKAYVANAGSNSVSVIDATNTAVATVAVGTNPLNVAITPDGTRAYVANAGARSVSVIDTATNTVTATVAVGRNPVSVAMTPDGTKAYVTNAGNRTVSVISTATNTLAATVTVGLVPVSVTITPNGTKAYVTNALAGSVSVIDTGTNTIVSTIGVGSNPVDAAVTPDGTKAYVTNAGAGYVSVIDTMTNTVVSTIAVGSNPVHIAVAPDGTKAYVTNAGSASVSVIDTKTNAIVGTITVGRSPVDIAVTPDGTKAYVTNAGANSVSVIGTANNTVAATVAVGTGPVNVALH